MPWCSMINQQMCVGKQKGSLNSDSETPMFFLVPKMKPYFFPFLLEVP